MGARISLEIMRLAPQRVSRLAIANTGVHTVQSDERQKREALSKLGHKAGFEALVDEWLPPMIGQQHRDNSVLMKCLKSMCLSAGQDVYDRQISALLSRPDPVPVLSKIDCPVYVIVGAGDKWSPVEQHQDIASRIEGAQLRIVPNTGHMLPAEDPKKFIAILHEWMAEDINRT
jgi:pimeloyl-ACP methyl ester carboxylesterase